MPVPTPIPRAIDINAICGNLMKEMLVNATQSPAPIVLSIILEV
jgi:hypothetical protein